MIGMQDEDAVHRARENGIGLVLLARHRKAHAQEVGRVVELVLRIDERLADRIFVGHRGHASAFCAIMRIEAIIRWVGSEMSVES